MGVAYILSRWAALWEYCISVLDLVRRGSGAPCLNHIVKEYVIDVEDRWSLKTYSEFDQKIRLKTPTIHIDFEAIFLP